LQEFVKALNARFAMLNIVKSQKASRNKDTKEKLKITNELKILIALDAIFNLWSQMVSRNVQGDRILRSPPWA